MEIEPPVKSVKYTCKDIYDLLQFEIQQNKAIYGLQTQTYELLQEILEEIKVQSIPEDGRDQESLEEEELDEEILH